MEEETAGWVREQAEGLEWGPASAQDRDKDKDFEVVLWIVHLLVEMATEIGIGTWMVIETDRHVDRTHFPGGSSRAIPSIADKL
jgi:hypothetical protein